MIIASKKKSGVIMLRERVDIRGRIRPMEAVEEMPALRIPPSQIGLIKEAPVRRWQQGQGMWDEQFKRESKKVSEKRKKLEEKAGQIVRRATELGLVVNTGASEARASGGHVGGEDREVQDEVRPMVQPQGRRKSSRSVLTTTGIIDENRRYGPLDLDDENPPPSAIARRRDTVRRFALVTVSLTGLRLTLISCSPRHWRYLGNASITPHRQRTTRFRRGKPWMLSEPRSTLPTTP